MSMKTRSMLSTSDNPFNPFDQWKEWLAFDMAHGYNSCGLLARFAISSNDLSDEDQQIAIESAIDDIVELNPLGIFIKVEKEMKVV